jgi:hypothetical protein
MGGIGMRNRKCPISKSVHIDENEFKNNLQTILTKLTILRNKKRITNPDERKQIIEYLKQDRLASARNKLKQYLHNIDLVIAYEEVLEALEILYEWSTYMLRLHHMFEEFSHLIVLVIWASQYIDINEFKYIREKFRLKYGETFVNIALNNTGGIVSSNIVNILENWHIEKEALNQKLKDIAEEEGIEILRDISDELLDEEAVNDSAEDDDITKDVKYLGEAVDNFNMYLTATQPPHHR